MLCHGLVCRQHKVLDNIRGRIAFIGPDIHGMPLPVQENLALREIKINGAPSLPLFSENSRKLLHMAEHGKKLSVLQIRLVRLRQPFVLQHVFHRSVGHALIDPDHGLADLVIHDFPF